MQIVITDVPKELHDAIAARAALHCQSTEEFIRSMLERAVAKPSNKKLMKRVRARLQASGTHVPASEILRYRDADRK